jgi:hypothetical protein
LPWRNLGDLICSLQTMSWDWLVIRTFWCVFDAKKPARQQPGWKGVLLKTRNWTRRGAGSPPRVFCEVCLFCTGAPIKIPSECPQTTLWGLTHETNFCHRRLHGPGFGADGQLSGGESAVRIEHCKGWTGTRGRFGATSASSASTCRGASRQGEIPYW